MYAIKIIDKKALKGKEDSLENEIRVLKRYNAVTLRPGGIPDLTFNKNISILTNNYYIARLDHRNVVKLLEAYESRTCVYLVMEL